jgi:hypothetical protein
MQKPPPTKVFEMLTPKSGDNMLQAPPSEALQGKGLFAPPGNTWPSEARGLGQARPQVHSKIFGVHFKSTPNNLECTQSPLQKTWSAPNFTPQNVKFLE